ncbi:hypothetical protein MW887_003794 [Aspergillus wentii]|nr:hypothetical protein MW887_003794 [Aspergillus wentii]
MNPRRRSRNSEEANESTKRQRRKFVACQRCHAHKIKCSGDQPCAKCVAVGCADECQYAPRDRQVKVNESYLDLLLSENRRLREQSGSSVNEAEATNDTETGPPRTAAEIPDESSTGVSNPLIGDRAWFHPYAPSAPPIFIGEAACTAFATRFRRFLTGSNATAHIPRTQYVKDWNIAAANADNVQWPSLQQARLLVKIAVYQIGSVYHLLLRKSTFEKLEEIYQTGDFDNTINKCKFFALFAFGEAYSMRAEPASGSRVPGTSYFARAMGLLLQVLPERMIITHLETLLLLMGVPSQILDEDIHLDMPSSIDPPQLHDEQFSDPEYLTANVKLARIVGETIAKLYSRRKYSETFLQRVQKLLKALKNWVETLPEHIRLNQDDLEANKKHITSLHLSFNQCVILTTRPTLLHLLIKLSDNGGATSNRGDGSEVVSQPVLTLGEACIHAARHSYTIILSKWIKGSLPVFGYFHAHYLFSSALVLAMSSFVPIGNPGDLGSFTTALEVLRSMSENGNLAASEFFHNLEQVKICLDRYREERQQRRGDRGTGEKRNGAAAIGPGGITAYTPTPSMGSIMGPGEAGIGVGQNYGTAANIGMPVADAAGGFTTAMAFLEPTMQDFLAQSDFDLGMLNPVDTFMNDTESLYTYHGL